MPIHRYPGGVINADNVTPGANQASGVWTLESQLQANGAGNWPQSTSQMSRSLRFNSADSAYLTRTPTAVGNRKTFTWSGWVKRSGLTSSFGLFSAGQNSSTSIDAFEFNASNQIRLYSYSSAYLFHYETTAVYRDVSAWYHIVVAIDTTQATASNRVKLYVNGVQVTAFSTQIDPTQNSDCYWFNTVNPHALGSTYIDSRFLNGYMTEVVFVDGQALDATSFGYTDSNNVWQPKPYAGSVGTNGFYLTFADNTSNTATGIGKDYSNRGNNWTPVNFSVASGAGNDSLVDVPTNWGTDTGLGGEVRGNYCTLNPLKQTGATLTNGNLQFTKAAGSGSTLFTIHSTLFVGAGKWYFEVTPTAVVSGYDLVGVVGPEVALTTYGSLASMTGNLWAYRSDAYKVNNGSSASYGNTWTSNDVIGVAIDMDNSKIWFSKNGTWQASGDPAAGTNAAYTNLTGSVAPLLIDQGAGTFDGFLNAGQRPFAYAAPSGFKALCTQNLPTPTVQDGGQYFNTVLYSGNAANPRSLTGVGFQPDWVWVKQRTANGSGFTDHQLYDAVRGTQKLIRSNDTAAELSNPSNGGVQSFDSNGFTVQGPSATLNINASGENYVAWNWKANGAGSSNTAGSITSTVSVSTLSGFSIVTYTGNSTQGATVGHGLGVAPRMVIVKNRTNPTSWYVYHASLTSAAYSVYLNLTIAEDGPNSIFWNNTAPTSTVFTIGGSTGLNLSGDNYVAYCFAEVAGYSAFGKYTGNGSADGPFIYTGFRPRYVLMKCTSAASQWLVVDTARSTYNVIGDAQLYPNSSSAQGGGGWGNYMDIVSNGFKLRGFDNDNFNSSADTYIYAAFAENPFKIARAR